MTTTQPPVPPPHAKRYHLVLVPGFVGFDALGQLVYYAGVTEAFGLTGGEARLLLSAGRGEGLLVAGRSRLWPEIGT